MAVTDFATKALFSKREQTKTNYFPDHSILAHNVDYFYVCQIVAVQLVLYHSGINDFWEFNYFGYFYDNKLYLNSRILFSKG